MSSHILRFKEYYKLAKVGKIARRLFAMNSFDGILTILGILIGGYFTNLHEPRVLLGAALGAAAAMAVSGSWGTFMTESAERKMSIRELEKHTFNKLHDTKIGRANRFGAIFIAAVDGLSPFVASLVVLLPFFLGFFLPIGITMMYLYSIIIAFILLFCLGMYLGNLGKDNLLWSGFKMVLAGATAALIGWLLTR